MSIKNLFGKSVTSYEDVAKDVESTDFIDEVVAKRETYLPPIDFSDPANFVFYGSAELYYEAAIKRIYEDYPYDGSKAEQIDFEEKSSFLERWLFENKYPKTTGHAQLGTTGTGSVGNVWEDPTATHEYIRVWGGLHTGSASSALDYQLSKSAVYDEANNRTQNWNCEFDTGVTTEFWLKKDDTWNNSSTTEVILDLHNGEPLETAGSRLVLALKRTSQTEAKFYLGIDRGTGVFISVINSAQAVDLNNWKHFAFTFYKESNRLYVRMYVNGELHTEADYSYSGTPDNIPGKVDGYIGALQSEVGSIAFPQAGEGYGKLLASLDEFRFWKTRRTDRQIKLNWFREIGGGANTDDNTSDLGVYLKFNEGITGNTSIDSTVLDYSGRLANGHWEGYPGSSARSTVSAMNVAGYTETPTPIIYSNHPDVAALEAEMTLSGSDYDSGRGQAFYRSLPNWLVEEDQLEGEENLRKISHILSSYMDTLRVQIDSLNKLQDKQYISASYKASPFASELLKNKGFTTSEMFLSAEVFETFSNIDYDQGQYDLNIDEIKNLIFTNIYNNLENIYNTKGTEKSIRNLIRCFGIDDELIKLNQYTDGGTQYLGDKYRTTSVKKKYVNLNDPDHFDGTMYQSGTLTFISGASEASVAAFTMEADILVPYKKKPAENGYFGTPFLSASVMGFHEANASNAADFTWQTTSTEARDLQVYLVRDSLNSDHAQFVLKNQSETIYITSSFIEDIYENEHYNIALRIKPDTYPYAGNVTNASPNYDIELYAVSHNFDELKQEILLSASVDNVTGSEYLQAPKRIYAGAHYQDFTGSTLQRTDLQFGRVSAWLDYLPNSSIKEHNKDVLNYGNDKSIDGSTAFSIDDMQIPSMELSILNWDFDTVTTSDASGEFVIEDTTSGSSDTIYGWVDNIIRREHDGKGDNFPISSTSFLSNEFLYANKKQLPETSFNANNIFIKGDEEINFGEDDDVSDNLFVLEKSPASIVSEEMLKLFSTTQEFSNLFGRHVDRYRIEYKDLARARQLFYQRVDTGIDFDKFFNYFKWIDQSISEMINQLIPASVNFAGGVVDVIEPHILERDKYQRQVGLLQTVTSTEASIRGVQEMNYNWRIGHAPIPLDDTTNSLWQKERSERDTTERQAIAEVLTTQVQTGSFERSFLSGSDGVYEGRAYATRRFSRPVRAKVEFRDSIHGGTNYEKAKDRDFLRSGIGLHSSRGPSGAPKNVVTFGAGPDYGLNYEETLKDQDAKSPSEKIKIPGFGVVGKFTEFFGDYNPISDDAQYLSRRKMSHVFIGNIISGSVNTGYNSKINNSVAGGGYREGVNLVNLHSDTTDITNEIPIQGPFTERWIGGHQHRHVALNSVGKPERFTPSYTTNGLDHEFSRPEGWRLLVGKNPLTTTNPDGPDADDDGAIGFTAPDYGIAGPPRNAWPDSDRLYAIYYREERAKRPVNIKNIQTLTSSAYHGNYQHEYEVFSTVGDQGYFLKRAGNLLPDAISQDLPSTTNYMTLVGVATFNSGNVFGVENNNRQPNGELIITPEVPSEKADNSYFKVLGRDFVTDGNTLSITNVVGTEIFEIDDDGSFTHNQVQVGSTDTEFFDNLTSSIESNLDAFNASYVAHPAVYSTGVSFRNHGAQGLVNSSSFGTELDGNEFTFAAWVQVPSGSGKTYYIYSENSADGNLQGREIFIENLSNGRLVYEVNYTDSNPTNRVDQYIFNGFRDTYSGSLNHIIISNDSTDPGESAATLYINGQLQSWNQEIISSPVGAVSLNSPRNFFIGWNSSTLNLGNTSTDIGIIDEVVLMNISSSTGEMKDLYNNGKAWATGSLVTIDYASDVVAYYSFEDVTPDMRNGEVVNDEKSFQDLIVVDNDALDHIRPIDGIHITESSASFTLTPQNNGTYGNLTLTDTGDSFFDRVNGGGGVNYVAGVSIDAIDLNIETQNRSTGSSHVIRTRFSAPGGPEVNSSGYLDVATQQYSVHNSINFRNLTTRGSGSGEDGTMRVVSHSNRREGLRTLRARNQGQFGIDSQHGIVSSTDYNAEASYHKQHRNTRRVAKLGDFANPTWTTETLEVIYRYDNAHYHTPLPASDFQYSWINAAVSGSDWESDQIVLGYAPRNGIISSSSGIESAISFPASNVPINEFFQSSPSSPNPPAPQQAQQPQQEEQSQQEEQPQQEEQVPPQPFVGILSFNRSSSAQSGVTLRTDDGNTVFKNTADARSREELTTVLQADFNMVVPNTVADNVLDTFSFNIENNTGFNTSDLIFRVSIESRIAQGSNPPATFISDSVGSVPNIPTLYYNPGGYSSSDDSLRVTLLIQDPDGTQYTFDFQIVDATIEEPTVSVELNATQSGIPTTYANSVSLTMLSDGSIVRQTRGGSAPVVLGQFVGTESNIGSCSNAGTFGGSISSTVGGSTTNSIILPSTTPPSIGNLRYSSGASVTYNVNFSACNGLTDSITLVINNAYIS